MPTTRITKKKNYRGFMFWLNLLRTQVPNFEPNSITLNINEKFKPHKHQRQSDSYIMLLGDFQGGALCLADGTKFNEKHKFFKFDGSQKHWVEDWTGIRISVVFYYKKSQKDYE